MYQGYPQQNQPMYYQNQQKALYTQPLSIDKIKKMMSGTSTSWSLNITDEEKDEAMCTHKDPMNGNALSLKYNEEDNSHTCYICKQKMYLEDYSREEIESIVNQAINLVQLSKLWFFDIPANVASSYSLIIPMLKKLPGFYKLAQDNFNKYNQDTMGVMNNNNPFAMFNSIMSSSYGMMGNPMMNQMGMQQPMGGMMNNMPVMNPMQGSNPLGGYGMPQGGMMQPPMGGMMPPMGAGQVPYDPYNQQPGQYGTQPMQPQSPYTTQPTPQPQSTYQPGQVPAPPVNNQPAPPTESGSVTKMFKA